LKQGLPYQAYVPVRQLTVTWYRPVDRAVRTSPSADRYANRPLPGGTVEIDHQSSIEGERRSERRRRGRNLFPVRCSSLIPRAIRRPRAILCRRVILRQRAILRCRAILHPVQGD
ncbi:hypothetical protein BHE74_00008391, partial [Ensete ventricosum]